MDAKTMLQRESFTDVLYKTIAHYFKTVHNIDVTITKNRLCNSKKMYIYYLPLFVSGFPVTRGMRKFLYSEYNVRGSWLKYFIGKFGVFVITHSFGLFASDSFYISSENKIPNYFISPCNRTIRFYNFDKNHVDCIVKNGYKSDYLHNQVKFRLGANYTFIPQIMENGETWYRERIMYGNALARVRDEQVYQKSITDTMKYLKQLVQDTMIEKDSLNYYHELKQEINRLLDNLLVGCESRKIVELLLYPYLEKLFNKYTMKILVSISHGDLQSGNIWVTRDGDTIIYDWETVGIRSIWFDPAVFFWHLHRGAFSADFDKLIRNDNSIFINDPNREYNKSEKKIISSVILLEDLIFHLSEAEQLYDGYSKSRAENVLASLSLYLNRRIN